MQIIDAHTHIGKQNCYEFQETPDEMIFSQKKSGVNGAIFHPMTGTVAATEEDMEKIISEFDIEKKVKLKQMAKINIF